MAPAEFGSPAPKCGVKRARPEVPTEIAPSPALRQWYGHDPARWDEFQRRYRDELAADTGPLDELLQLATEHDLTLVYAARDEPGNSAQVLRDCLLQHLGRR